jgi:hypothetical protein
VTAGDLSGAALLDVLVSPGSSSTSGGRSLTLTSGDGNTSGGGVTIKECNGSMASGGFITISLGVGTATSSGSMAVSTSSAGTVGVFGDLVSLSIGNVTVGNSGTVDIGTGSSTSGSGSSIAFSVGNRGVQPSRRQRTKIVLDLAFYHDANTILLNNPGKDEFLDIRGYDGAWWLASTAVLAFLTFKDVLNSNRLFFLHAFT